MIDQPGTESAKASVWKPLQYMMNARLAGSYQNRALRFLCNLLCLSTQTRIRSTMIQRGSYQNKTSCYLTTVPSSND
jgi:hypothetical protein